MEDEKVEFTEAEMTSAMQQEEVSRLSAEVAYLRQRSGVLRALVNRMQKELTTNEGEEETSDG